MNTNLNLIGRSMDLLKTNKFTHIPAILKHDEKLNLEDWLNFKKSWHNLSLDHYMGDNGKYRYRRYSVLSWNSDSQTLSLEKHQPHYQDVYFNSLNGGIQRLFDPFETEILNSSCFKKFVNFGVSVFNAVEPNVSWHIEAHQFRIVANNDYMSSPTPEGVHRDGRHYIFMTLIDKKNASGGVTSLYNDNKELVTEVTLQDEGDTFLVHDESMMHGVSPIKKIDASKDAYRDTLVITYYRK